MLQFKQAAHFAVRPNAQKLCADILTELQNQFLEAVSHSKLITMTHLLQLLYIPAVCRRTNILTYNSKSLPFYFPLLAMEVFFRNLFHSYNLFVRRNSLPKSGGGRRGTQTYCKSISVVLCCLATLLASLIVVLLHSAVAALRPNCRCCCERPNNRTSTVSCRQQTDRQTLAHHVA
jgi:hypothetical protein